MSLLVETIAAKEYCFLRLKHLAFVSQTEKVLASLVETACNIYGVFLVTKHAFLDSIKLS